MPREPRPKCGCYDCMMVSRYVSKVALKWYKFLRERWHDLTWFDIPTGCFIMIAYSWKNTSWQGRAKWKIPPCREFNSTSDGVFFIKNVAAVLVLRQKKRNQLQNSVLQEVGQRQSRIWVMYAYLNNFNELWAKISKVSTLWEQLLASKRSDLQFIC